MYVEKFEIERLFGYMNVSLNLNSKENIYIGENGIGKTTILNTLYYTLKGKFNELINTDFKNISIKFSGQETIKFNKREVELYLDLNRNRNNHRFSRNIIDQIEKQDINLIQELLEILKESSPSNLFENSNFQSLSYTISSQTRLPVNMIKRELIDYMIKLDGNQNPLISLIEAIKKFGYENEVLYFPTFRRIEEDINKLVAFAEENEVEYIHSKFDSNNNDKYGELIRFGMEDVQKKIDLLLEKISKTSINSFNQMTAILLKQYVNNDIQNVEDNLKNKIDKKSLEISLNRIGETIGKEYKEKIIELVDKEEIYNSENKYLLNFIFNLLKSHKQLEEIDDKIEKFATVCNHYLVNKKYKYDPSNVTLQIINLSTQKEIFLKNLSSGEKQIISTFSKIYLEHKKNYFILFDEPELSLSIDWQDRYIPHIMDSGNCNQIICVTHSPFIFTDNGLFDESKEILDEITYLESECELEHVSNKR